MNLAELQAEVYSITGRADLITLTLSAIKSATLKAHQTDFFSKDIYENSYQFANTSYTHSLDIITQIPNYRAMKYMRKYDTSTGEAGTFFNVLTPEEILDEWGRTRQDVCYIAGRTIEINSSTEFNTILLGCYVTPVVTEVNFSSWVADIYPYAIIHEAARVVLLSIAQREEANSQRELVAEQYAELKINALPDVGS